jgi:hypothetical protein
MPLRKAAKEWGIPPTTLHRRANGSTSRRDANQHNQRLSETQETSLASWSLAQGELWLAPTQKQIKDFARRILIASGDQQPLGKR